MSWLVNRYNKKSSKKYGWHPNWFGDHYTEIDSELIKKIKTFQEEHDLDVDGKVGPVTFRRLLSTRDLKEEHENYILIDGVQHPIDCKVKIDLMPDNCYRKYKSMRKPTMIVTHWDATTSAERCKRVLQARGISTHFCIDNDGTIFQFVDTNHKAFHAGRVANKCSIGIDFSNAYYIKYANYYERKGLPPRPFCRDSRVHGVKLKPHLGFYTEQINSYKKLLKILSKEYKIPLEVPLDENDNLLTKVHEESAKGKFKGVVSHYHLTRNKIDCAGLKMLEIVKDIRGT